MAPRGGWTFGCCCADASPALKPRVIIAPALTRIRPPDSLPRAPVNMRFLQLLSSRSSSCAVERDAGPALAPCMCREVSRHAVGSAARNRDPEIRGLLAAIRELFDQIIGQGDSVDTPIPRLRQLGSTVLFHLASVSSLMADPPSPLLPSRHDPGTDQRAVNLLVAFGPVPF